MCLCPILGLFSVCGNCVCISLNSLLLLWSLDDQILSVALFNVQPVQVSHILRKHTQHAVACLENCAADDMKNFKLWYLTYRFLFAWYGPERCEPYFVCCFHEVRCWRCAVRSTQSWQWLKRRRDASRHLWLTSRRPCSWIMGHSRKAYHLLSTSCSSDAPSTTRPPGWRIKLRCFCNRFHPLCVRQCNIKSWNNASENLKQKHSTPSSKRKLGCYMISPCSSQISFTVHPLAGFYVYSWTWGQRRAQLLTGPRCMSTCWPSISVTGEGGAAPREDTGTSHPGGGGSPFGPGCVPDGAGCRQHPQRCRFLLLTSVFEKKQNVLVSSLIRKMFPCAVSALETTGLYIQTQHLQAATFSAHFNLMHSCSCKKQNSHLALVLLCTHFSDFGHFCGLFSVSQKFIN